MNNITPAFKDKLLYLLCEHCPFESYVNGSTQSFFHDLNCDFETLNAVMNQFQRYGFISDLNLQQKHISFILYLEAQDYLRIGGFTAQEDVFKTNLNKLTLEIENLKQNLEPKHLESANKISAIASALFTGLSLFK